MITTDALTLRYTATSAEQGKFTADDLTIEFKLNGQTVTWHPGMADAENLQGTTRTLDGALGSKTKEPIEPGLLSRSGWSVVDDSKRPLFDSDDFSFAQGEKEPVAVGDRAAGWRSAGSLFLRVRPRV